MNAASSDPDYCDHGRALDESCFFCGRGDFTQVFSTPAGRPLVPAHRNPPASATPTHFELHARGASKRGAAAKHKAVKPKPPAAPADPANRGGHRGS